MSPDDLVMDVIESGYMHKYLRKFFRSWMDPEEFEAELYLATVRASRKYRPEKGGWHTFVYWWWRSARSEMTRQYAKRNKYNKSVSLESLEYEPQSNRHMGVIGALLEKRVDALSDEDRFYLLGASLAETGRRGITRSQYEIRRRQIRRKLGLEI